MKISTLAMTLLFFSAAAQAAPGPELQKAIEDGKRLYSHETFGGNGKTCETCHVNGGVGPGKLPDGRSIPSLENAAAIFPRFNPRAKKIIADLKKGANFSKLAAEKSEDPGSKTHGGELDWAPASNFVQPFADAVRLLKKGEITPAPVQTPFGWHVIQLQDEKALKLPTFDQVKPQLQQRVQQEHIQKLISDLRAAAKVEE